MKKKSAKLICNNTPNQLTRITCNFTGKTRLDTMEGKEYLVAPMIMMLEGVHEGSGGAILYPSDELSDCPQAWNYKPVVVYHPECNGTSVSACDPIILSNRKVGVVMNAKTTTVKHDEQDITALKAEAWLDEDRIKAVDERIATAIETNTMMELSTGLFTKVNNEAGEWNGKKYVGIAKDYRPDHLALLPDLKGACSIEDGAGFLRNQVTLKATDKVLIINNAMSHGNIRSLINSWLWETKEDTWVEAVYDDFFVYEMQNKFYKLDYKLEDNLVVITGIEQEVVRVTEFRTPTGEFVGNERKGSNMDKKKVVESIIASNSNSWTKEDTETLMALNEAALVKMQESETLAATKAVENAVAEAAASIEPEVEVNKTDKTEVPVVNAKPKTMEQHLAEMPKEIADTLRSSMVLQNQMKERLIKKIIDNERNSFTEKQLRAKEIEDLKGIAAIATNDSEEEVELDYLGQGIGNTVPIGNAAEITPLIMPSVIAATKSE